MLNNFNPDDTLSAANGVFGLPFSETDAQLCVVPVPWEATTSYGGGTAQGPKAILAASPQLDLFDLRFRSIWQKGIYLTRPLKQLKSWNARAKRAAQSVAKSLEKGHAPSRTALTTVNSISDQVMRLVETECARLRARKKIVAVLGGDHSSPLGLIKTLDKEKIRFGILHFDAHLDLRESYQGFRHSHASIMFNVLRECTYLTALVGVGYRDFSQAEYNLSQSDQRITTFFDRDVKARLLRGEPWAAITDEIVERLPQHVYVSFDIDGLDPAFCPNTGTPVPGGLSYDQAVAVLERVVESGRTIIGFDLVEVAPGRLEWDANVGARLLYQLCGWCLKSQPESSSRYTDGN
jgi:agmatinase